MGMTEQQGRGGALNVRNNQRPGRNTDGRAQAESWGIEGASWSAAGRYGGPVPITLGPHQKRKELKHDKRRGQEHKTQMAPSSSPLLHTSQTKIQSPPPSPLFPYPLFSTEIGKRERTIAISRATHQHTLPRQELMQTPTMSTSMATPAMAPAAAKLPVPRQCYLLLPGRRAGLAGGALSASAKKKNPWLDPFDDGPDEDFDYTGVYSGGKQEEDPRPPEDPANPYGFLRFPMGYNPELDSLASKVRGDVRRACCVVSGGVYENVLFFPVVQLLRDRYPGVLIDVVASARGKQVYEMCKNVRYANVYDPDDDWPEPAEYTHQLGVLKNRYYDMILSTKLAGTGHALFLFMSSAREKVGYVYPNVNGAGAGLFLTEMFKPPTTNLSDGGYNMYQDMLEWLGRPAKNVPRQPIPPLKVSISKKLRAVVEDKYNRAGVEKGKYVVVHGIASDSVANMKSRGDDDCLLPLEQWAEIAKEISSEGSGLRPLFVIPHEKHKEEVEEIVGEETSYLFITTPGQLTCLINDSAGVIATNTAAVQLANARDKPCVALFSSKEKARLFLPYAEEKSCTVIASETGKLIDIDIEAVKNAVKDFEAAPSLALAQK